TTTVVLELTFKLGIRPSRMRLLRLRRRAKSHQFGLGSQQSIEGRTIWIADAHGYRKRFIARADEILTSFLELEAGLAAKRQETICLSLALARSARCPVGPPGQ